MLAIQATKLSKAFAGKPVLQNVDLAVRCGEVHGLLGQNGSGKSTLIKILAGYHEPDPGGTLKVRGAGVSLPLSAGRARQLGMSFVHQDLGIANSMTVLENMRVGLYQSGFAWRIPWRRERAIVESELRRFDLDVDPDARVGTLQEVERAMIAIIRALQTISGHRDGLLVLDEPTTYLPQNAVDRLFAAVRRVADDGVGVLLVTHKLDEARAVTERVTVLRDGLNVGTVASGDVSERELAEMILGRGVGEMYPPPPHARSDVLLSARGLGGDRVRDVALEVRKGEIIGLTGLVGSGYEEVPHTLFGASKPVTGEVTIEEAGTHQLADLTPREAMRLGLALLPANRLVASGVSEASVRENVTLPSLGRHFRRGRLDGRGEAGAAGEALRRFGVVPADPTRPLRKLSGGNQQKALLAKWFMTTPKVLLLHEPTQGVDVGARAHIFTFIRDLAESGAGVVIASAEQEDLAHLCSRVLVFHDGAVRSELEGADVTYERIAERTLVG